MTSASPENGLMEKDKKEADIFTLTTVS